MDTELAYATPNNASAGSAIARAEGGLRVSCTPVEEEVERLGSILASNEEGFRCRFYRNNVEGGQLDVFDVAGYRASDSDGPRLHCRCNPEVRLAPSLLASFIFQICFLRQIKSYFH